MAIISVSLVAQAVAEVPTGVLADRLGRASIFRLSAFLSFAAVACFAAAGTVVPGAAALVAGAVLDGVGLAAASGNEDALIHDALDAEGRSADYPRQRSRVLSLIETAGFLSVALGTLLVSGSLTALVVISLVPSGIAAALSLAVRSPSPNRHGRQAGRSPIGESVRALRGDRALISLFSAVVASNVIGGAMWALQPAFYALFMPLTFVGPLMSVNYLESALGFRPSWRAVARFGAERTLFAAEALSRISALGALFASAPWSPFALAASGAGYPPAETARNAMLMARYPPASRATAGSLLALSASLLSAVVSPLAGALADRVGITGAMITMGICLLPTLLVYARLASLPSQSHPR